jgi:hypothetical protein
VNSYRSEEERHIDVHPRTRALSTPLCHLPSVVGDILASVLDRRGRLLCHIAQITSGNSHSLHHLLCRVFHLTRCLCKPISDVLGILPDVFRFWESPTQLLPAFAQEALRLFPSQEKDGQAGNHTDSNEESCHNTVHASSSFLRSNAEV